MIVDFADFNRAVKEVLDPFDHAFAIHEGDPIEDVLRALEERRYFKLSHPPTAEILASLWHRLLEEGLSQLFPEEDYAIAIEVWETAKSSAHTRAPELFVTLQWMPEGVR